MTRLLTSFPGKVKQSVSVLESDPTMALSMQFSADDEAFREEVRDFLNTHLSPALRDAAARQLRSSGAGGRPAMAAGASGGEGLGGPGLAKAFGAGFSANQRYIFNQECARRRRGLIPLGLRMLAPVLFRYGTRAASPLLPKILSGEHYWCRGYSEPGSGSDSSLRTTATRTETFIGSMARNCGPPMAISPITFSAWCAPIAAARPSAASTSAIPMATPEFP